MQAETTADFPAGLTRWSGQRDGGVRKPFAVDSGRPAGKQFETPLVARLRAWVDDLVAGQAETPRALLLVGGPGNGKTDAIEGCIEYLDERLDAGGRLFECFSTAFDVEAGALPPRKVVVDLGRLGTNIPVELSIPLVLVQDATEGEPEHRLNPEELLLGELDELLSEHSPHIYLCCVNRGILANAATVAHTRGGHELSLALLTAITEAVTSGPPSMACWPLQQFPQFGIWPMDVESLVHSTNREHPETVFHDVLRSALEETRWGVCSHELGSRCPFCRNRVLLSDEKRASALIRILRYHELASGQRWSFRDLYSLVSYLLVGEQDELQIGGHSVPPCEWAAHQLEAASSGRASTPEKVDAPFLLMARLYHHRLFPLWPALTKGAFHTAQRAIFRGASLDGDLEMARGFFRYLSRAKAYVERAAGNVPRRVRGSVSTNLDPALCTGGTMFFKRGGEEFTIADVETRFSLSVSAGLEFVGSFLEPLERDVLKVLASADEGLMEDRFSGTQWRRAQLLQAAVRQFSCRLAKRSIGTRRGICKDIEHLEAYEGIVLNDSSLNDVRKQLKRLLHDDGSRFRAGLATTFGQPVALRNRDVSFVMSSAVPVKEWKRESAGDRPAESLPYLRVRNHYVPLTFVFYKAMREVVDGLHPASLPGEVFSFLDRVKSTVSGQVVRDPSVLEDDPVIVLGSSGEHVDILNGKFQFGRGDEL